MDVPDGRFAGDRLDGVVLQAIAGIEFEFAPRRIFSADYRLWITSEIKIRLDDGESGKAFLLSHSMAAGLRYALP